MENPDGIFKVKTSGNDIENIKNVNQPDMRVSNDYIYYISDNAIESENISMETNHLHRCKLDGSEDVDLIKTPVFCFYVFDNFILYQDDRDNESLHTFDLQSEKDTKLNDMKSYDPQLDGEKIYFRSHEGEDEFYTLWSMNIDGSDINKIVGIKCGSAFVLHDDKIYYSNAEDEYRLYSVNKDGTNINQVTQDNHVGNFYFEHGKLFYITYNNSYTDKCIMCDENGNNAINLFE